MAVNNYRGRCLGPIVRQSSECTKDQPCTPLQADAVDRATATRQLWWQAPVYVGRLSCLDDMPFIP